MKATHFFIGLFAMALASCGGGDSPKPNKAAAPAQSMIEKEKPAEPTSQSTGEINIAGNDEMKYDKSVLKAKAGEEVTVVLTHSGKLPKAAMGHNFVLLKQGADMATFATKAMTAAENDYIPEGTDEVIAHTKTIGGGETTSVTFIAPAAGTYQFLCTFPGHYAMMNGEFIVE